MVKFFIAAGMALIAAMSLSSPVQAYWWRSCVQLPSIGLATGRVNMGWHQSCQLVWVTDYDRGPMNYNYGQQNVYQPPYPNGQAPERPYDADGIEHHQTPGATPLGHGRCRMSDGREGVEAVEHGVTGCRAQTR